MAAFRGESARRRWALGGNRNPPGRRVPQENQGSLGRIFAYFLFATCGGAFFGADSWKWRPITSCVFSLRLATYRSPAVGQSFAGYRNLQPYRRVSFLQVLTHLDEFCKSEHHDVFIRKEKRRAPRESSPFYFCRGRDYSALSSFFLESITLARIPRINAQAMEVMVTLPKVRLRPPIPEIRMVDTTKRFLFSSRLTF